MLIYKYISIMNMNRTYFSFFIIILLGAAILVGCGKDNPGKINPDEENEEYLELLESSVSNQFVESDGGSFEISFVSSGAWTARIAGSGEDNTPEWLSLSSAKGDSGTSYITVSVIPNENYTERKSSVIISCGKISVTVNVTQASKDALIIGTKKYEINFSGGTFEVEVSANVPVSYNIEDDSKWISVVGEESVRGLTNKKFIFNVDYNNSVSERYGTITFTSENLEESIMVIQHGESPFIEVIQDEYHLSSKGGTIDVELKSTVPYSVIISDTEWINEYETRSISEHTHTFIVSENTSFENRTALIHFINEEYKIEKKVMIVQSQANTIIVPVSEYNVGYYGGNIEILVESNIEYDVVSQVSWIKILNQTRNLLQSTITLFVETNKSGSKRSGTVSIKSGDILKEVVINQDRNISAGGGIEDMPIIPW